MRFAACAYLRRRHRYPSSPHSAGDRPWPRSVRSPASVTPGSRTCDVSKRDRPAVRRARRARQGRAAGEAPEQHRHRRPALHCRPRPSGRTRCTSRRTSTLQAWLQAGILEARHAAGAVPVHADLRAQRPDVPPPRVHLPGAALAVRAGAGRPAREDLQGPDRGPPEADARHAGCSSRRSSASSATRATR